MTIILSAIAVIVAIALSFLTLYALKVANILKKRIWIVLCVLGFFLLTVGLTIHSLGDSLGIFSDPIGLYLLIFAPLGLCIAACCLGRFSYEFDFTGEVPEPSKVPDFESGN
ncbi:MAG: hypothetical protein ACW98U_13090 [Candidatus Thorarchaeota archaeon]|jgi:hypothetical protein